MHLENTPEQQRLRTELRAYFAQLVPEGSYTRHADPAAQKRFYRETIRRLGTDGWLGVGWPKEYGGRGLTAIEQFIFFDEAAQAGCPAAADGAQHRRPDDHAVRHRGAEVVLPAARPLR